MARTTLGRLWHWIALLALTVGLLPPSSAPSLAAPLTVLPTGLYRTEVALATPASRARLDTLGVTVLSADPARAMVIANGAQLASLARLGFEPSATDDLAALASAAGSGSAGAAAVASLASSGLASVAAVDPQQPESAQDAAARLGALATLDAGAQASIAALAVADADGDGLSDTEEGWWCTQPTIADSDGDRVSDGVEITAIRDWLRNRRGTAPSNGKPFLGWPNRIPGCYDDDQDSVPDMAEAWDLGLNPNRESTDRDKFDDGQELFGQTYCPGSGGFCGYGVLPRNEDWGVIFAEMPTWVRAPGNHPLVAAFPVPEIDVVPNSLRASVVTTITSGNTTISSKEQSYSTSKTEGTSTSVADTVTWNEWQEVAVTSPVNFSSTSSLDPSLNAVVQPQSAVKIVSKIPAAAQAIWKYCTKGSVTPNKIVTCAQIADYVVKGGQAGIEWIGSLIAPKKECYHSPIPTADQDACQNQSQTNKAVLLACSNTQIAAISNTANISSGCGVGSGTTEVSNEQYVSGQAPGTTGQEIFAGGVGHQLTTSSMGSNSQQRYTMAFPMSQPITTITNSSGRSSGGAQTTTTEQYEEHTVTNGESILSGEEWSNATATDSARAAELRFSYVVRNAGEEYAREIGNLAFNVYLGDDPNPIYTYFVAPDLGGDGTFKNFMPGQERTFTISRPIPLSLDQLKALDLDPACLLDREMGRIPAGQSCHGGKIRVVVADFSYGIDQLFYQDAINSGVRVAMEDGLDDGDELIDSYVLPTWGDEMVLDVLARYFPNTTDAQGNLTAIWTPERFTQAPAWCAEPVRPANGPFVWCKKSLSTAEWWNVYLDGLGDGSEGFQATPAAPASTALFRFNEDADRDGFSDRSELRLGSDPRDASSGPRPELLAGLHSVPANVDSLPAGSVVTSTVSLLNTGPYDAYGTEFIMVAPDDSISILNNTVGGSGRVRAFQQVNVGSRILPAQLSPWRGTAKPALGGYYSGTSDRTYTFTVSCAQAEGCTVGVGSWGLSWSDGLGASSTLNLGAGYKSPALAAIDALGLRLGMVSGTAFNGDRFTVAAQTPRDTFQYRINRQPHTAPLVVASYNDPQGNHRFVLPPAAMSLARPDASPQPFAGQMLPDPGVELLTDAPFAPGPNTVRLVAHNPAATTISAARLYLNVIDPLGVVTQEISTTITLPPGPTIVPMALNSAAFVPAYDAAQDYIVLAFLTDGEGNIIDTAGRPLSSFQADPAPRLVGDSPVIWDFGSAPRGTLLRRVVSFGNTGGMGLLTYASPPAGVQLRRLSGAQTGPGGAVEFELLIDTAKLQPGRFTAAVPIRTSDPARPEVEIQIAGTIGAAVIESAPGDPMRPLDVPVAVPAGQPAGAWLDYSQTLGPDPQSLHPARVTRPGDGSLAGVGRYATPFGAGTAAADLFGSGADGDLVVTAGQTITINNVRTNVTATGAGAAPASSTGFAVGDVVLFLQTQGTANAGRWELNKIAAISGPNSWTLIKPLIWAYDNTGGRAQVIKVPQYHNVTVQVGGTLTAPAWDGSTGGMLIYQADGAVVINGTITMSGKGYRGGAPGAMSGDELLANGFDGEGYPRASLRFTNNNQPNGNGGGSGDYSPSGPAPTACGNGGGGGGGGGNGTPGQRGGDITGVGNTGGLSGGTAGSADLSVLVFGGGGGGGGSGGPNGCGSQGYQGGNGSGAIILLGHDVQVGGLLLADGLSGAGAPSGNAWDEGAGGSGAGGSILVRGSTLTLGDGRILARGAAATIKTNGAPNYGGAGGAGRIRVEYCDTFSGAANPPASAQKLSCFIAEQVEAAPYDKGRLNLPEPSGAGATYTVEYGRRLVLASAGPQLTTLRVPGGIMDQVTMQALVSETAAGDLRLRLDVGDDGIWEWDATLPVDGGRVFPSPNLAAAFSAYWASHGAPAGQIDVPVRVDVSRGAQVLLTNLELRPTGSALRQLRLPTGAYSNLTLDLAVGEQGSGALSIAADVGDNGSIDWSTSAQMDFPAHLTTGNLAAAVSSYLAGRTGEADVPVRFYLTPFAPLSLLGLSAAQVTQPDLALADTDVSVSPASVAAGAMTEVSVTLRNTGIKASGATGVALVATVPGWGDWYVGAAYVADLPVGGSARVSIPWNTTGFAGAVAFRLVADPYGRIGESNEANNTAHGTLTVAEVTPTPTETPTPTSTATSTNTPTPTNTATPTATLPPTSTPINTSTATPTSSSTPTATNTPTASPTSTSTNVPTSTPTGSPGPSATPTSTGVPTNTPTATVTPVPSEGLQLPSLRVAAGTEVDVPVTLAADASGMDISAWMITIAYDPAVVQITGVSTEGTLSAGWSIESNSTVPGLIRVVAYSAQPLSGRGTLINLRARAVGAVGMETLLTFSEARLNEGQPTLPTFNGRIVIEPVSISGAVYYGSSTRPVAGATLSLTRPGGTSQTSTSATNGNYSFVTDELRNLAVTISKTGEVADSLSALDASWIAQYDARLRTFTVEQRRACDVSGDGSCTVYDATVLVAYLLGRPRPGTEAGTWSFDPAGRKYALLDQSMSHQDYRALVRGDVTSNWAAPSTAAAQSNAQLAAATAAHTVALRLPSLIAPPATNIAIPIQVSDLSELGVLGYELTLSYDSATFTVEGIRQQQSMSDGWTVTANIDKPGVVRIVGYGVKEMRNSGTLLWLNIKLRGSPGDNSPLAITRVRLNEGDPSSQTTSGRVAVGNVDIYLPLIRR